MHDDDDALRSLWQADDAAPDVVLDDVRRAAERLRAQARAGRIREYVAAAVVVPAALYFLAGAASAGRWMEVGSWILLVIATAFAVGVLWTRGEAPVAEPADSVVDFIEAHRKVLLHQARLLEWAWLWYFAPFVPGFSLMALAMWPDEPEPFFAVYYGIAVPAVFVVGIALNRRGARRLRAQAAELARPD